MQFPLDLSEDRYKRAAIAVYVLALFVQILDTTIVNVAIPTLAEAFGVTDAQIDRAIIGYLVSLAVCIPTSGWLADRFGSRQVFLASLGLFTIASMACGLSQSLNQLVLFRILQGAGAGVMGPLGAAILYRAFPQSERARAATAVMSVAVIAPASGPVLGGAILEAFSWHYIFFVNVPIGLAAAVVALLVIRDFKADDGPQPFDIAGFFLAGVGLGATLFGVTVAQEKGWSSPVVVVPIVFGLVSLVALVPAERRHPAPLLDFELFRAPIFRSISIVALPFYAAFFGPVFLIPVYLQSLRGFGAFEAGLTTFPQAIGVMLSSQFAGRVLYRRIGPRRLIILGALGAGLSALAMAGFGPDTSLWWVRFWVFTRGFFCGFAFIAIQTAVYAQTSIEKTAKATAMFIANRQGAPAIGVAVAAAVLSAAAADAAAPQLSAYRWAFAVSAALFVPALVAAFALVRDEDAAATLDPR